MGSLQAAHFLFFVVHDFREEVGGSSIIVPDNFHVWKEEPTEVTGQLNFLTSTLEMTIGSFDCGLAS